MQNHDLNRAAYSAGIEREVQLSACILKRLQVELQQHIYLFLCVHCRGNLCRAIENLLGYK
jgi:hypothetical protein